MRFKNKKIISLSIYWVGLFVFFEIVSRWIISVDSLWPRLFSMGFSCDSAWRINWIKRHEKRKIEIYYSFDVFNQTRGWSLKPNIHNWRVFDNKVLNSNSKGIRGTKEYSYEKPSGITRILILGDSYTFGEDVSDDETYSYYLEQMLPHTEVINFGVHGYGHDQILIYLNKEGRKYHPDIVILGFYSDDCYRNMLKFRDYAKPKFELANNKLKMVNVPVPAPETVLSAEIQKLKFFDFINILYQPYYTKKGTFESQKSEITQAILKETAETIRGMNAIPIFVFLDGVVSKNFNEQLEPWEQNQFKFCEQNDIHCLFLRQYVAVKIKDTVKFKQSGHYGPDGHHVIAQGIKDYLIERNLFKMDSR